jgi:hypothetical protein
MNDLTQTEQKQTKNVEKQNLIDSLKLLTTTIMNVNQISDLTFFLLYLG